MSLSATIKSLTLNLLFVLLLRASADAQKVTPFTIGEIHTIQSSALHEKRILNIYLPPGYAPEAAQKYPVIYLLDGTADEDFLHIAGITQFLTLIDTLPPTIVVGIANIDRKRDFTFPTNIKEDKQKYPTTGASAAFIDFLEKEVQPFIRQHYRTNDTSTLIGQSLGGLLATEILLKKPAMFRNYVIVSPSLWWDGESLLIKAPQLLAAQSDLPHHIFIAVGAEGQRMQDDAALLATTLQDAKKKSLKINFQFFPKEDHMSILHNGVYKALEVINAKGK